MDYKQEPPFSIQIEFSEGCSLYCDFCGLHGIREGVGDYKFMTIETLTKLAQQLKQSGWNSRIELAMHGEPSMNPKFVEMVRILRTHLPKSQLMMTSNGSGFIKAGRIKEVFDAGLTILALDKYDGCDFVDKALRNNEGHGVITYRYPDQPEGNPHQRTKHPFLSIVADISQTNKGTHAHLSNHCGAAAPLDHSKQDKRCAKPFRELSIRWDGSISLCCNDWRGVYSCGNLHEQSIEQIWQGMPFTLARRMLLTAGRKVPPCLGCNTVSYRTGLLPDKKGQVKLSPLTQEELSWMQQHSKKQTLSPIILRPWEKTGRGPTAP